MKPKLKVVRVVTAAYVVPWHLANTLKRMPEDFAVTVVGHGVSVHAVAYPDIQWVDMDLHRKINVFPDLRSLWELTRFLWAHQPDIVHSIMPKAGLLSALAGYMSGVPVRLHTFTGQVWVNTNPLVRFVLYWLDRVINALNTACLTDSPSQSKFLHRHHISDNGKPLPVLGMGSLSGVDFSRFDYPGREARCQLLREELDIQDQDFVFAFVARKSRDKGAIDILKAFAQVVPAYPRARLLFVGPDESAGELSMLKATTPLLFKNVVDIGLVENHDLYLSISNVLCLPSHREGFGSIVIDAAAAGVPAIGSRIVGLVDSIENGKTGILLPPGDQKMLVLAMLAMLENQQHCKEMGLAAKRRVESHFTADKMYASLREFYSAMHIASLRK